MMRTDKSKMRADKSRRVTIIIGELGFSSDLGFQKIQWIGSSTNTPPSSKI